MAGWPRDGELDAERGKSSSAVKVTGAARRPFLVDGRREIGIKEYVLVPEHDIRGSQRLAVGPLDAFAHDNSKPS